MYTIVSIYSWKLIMILSLTFCGGYIFGLRHNKFSLEDDDNDEE